MNQTSATLTKLSVVPNNYLILKTNQNGVSSSADISTLTKKYSVSTNNPSLNYLCIGKLENLKGFYLRISFFSSGTISPCCVEISGSLDITQNGTYFNGVSSRLDTLSNVDVSVKFIIKNNSDEVYILITYPNAKAEFEVWGIENVEYEYTSLSPSGTIELLSITPLFNNSVNSAGTKNTPVYLNSKGVPTPCSFSVYMYPSFPSSLPSGQNAISFVG